tara:strand:- start:550 stop:1245 length:696 start_codon:yes stop_codon:yes gene_type:complete
VNVTDTQLNSLHTNTSSVEVKRAEDRIESAVNQVTPAIPSTTVDVNYPAGHAPVSSSEHLEVYGIEARDIYKVHEETTKLSKAMGATQNEMKSAWDQIQVDLEKSNPALAAKDFGFSLDADGNLMVLERSDELSELELNVLTEVLNGSHSLKTHANDFARLAMDFIKADHVSMGLGKFNLDMNNFHSTIDFERMLDYEQTGSARWNATWYNQVWNKGDERNIIVEYEWCRK